jgi:hypothetical protein
MKRKDNVNNSGTPVRLGQVIEVRRGWADHRDTVVFKTNDPCYCVMAVPGESRLNVGDFLTARFDVDAKKLEMVRRFRSGAPLDMLFLGLERTKSRADVLHDNFWGKGELVEVN